MANIQNLIAGHAYWSDRKRELQNEFHQNIANCNGSQKKQIDPKPVGYGFGFFDMDSRIAYGENCFDYAMREWKDSRNGHNCEQITFIEIWEGMTSKPDGEPWLPCDHCKKAYTTRLEKAYAGKRLGAIRSAITRVGRSIYYKDASQ